MSPRLSLWRAKTVPPQPMPAKSSDRRSDRKRRICEENRGWSRGGFPFSKPPPSATRPPHHLELTIVAQGLADFTLGTASGDLSIVPEVVPVARSRRRTASPRSPHSQYCTARTRSASCHSSGDGWTWAAEYGAQVLLDPPLDGRRRAAARAHGEAFRLERVNVNAFRVIVVSFWLSGLNQRRPRLGSPHLSPRPPGRIYTSAPATPQTTGVK